ncbi:amidohydrolase family protein [Dactylosporangium sp. CA-233914]|uniref:amidohydrolase family protein n=1 Tax=Dactylosporangium sp. CA-233914 TaxID=3239934 RepID=UPI003D917141
MAVVFAKPRVVDMCDVVFDEPCWEAYLGALLTAAPGYLGAFGARLARLSGRPRAQLLSEYAAAPEQAVRDLARSLGAHTDVDAHVASLSAGGVDQQVLHGGPWSCPAGTVNDVVAGFAARHPDRLRFFAGVSLAHPEKAWREARRALDDLGADGLSVIPFLDSADITAPEHDQLWRLAVERQVPVWIHSGQSFRATTPMDISGPRAIDNLAGRHPQLRIVLGHGGWPWVLEAIALMQRHPQVYLEFSSHDPATMAQPGSGWEPLFLHGARSVRRKVLFGSTSWTHGIDVAQVAARASMFPVSDEVRTDWLHDNAMRLLGEPAAVPA